MSRDRRTDEEVLADLKSMPKGVVQRYVGIRYSVLKRRAGLWKYERTKQIKIGRVVRIIT